MEITDPLHAYIPFQLAVNSSQAPYDLKPEMSAYEVKDKLVEAIKTQKFDFIVVNYANGDMVGHTGIYDAIEKAVNYIRCTWDPFTYY